MERKRISYEEFIKSFENAPRPAISLLIENEKGEVLLTKREQKPFANHWHLPGSFIDKGESIHECIIRIGSDELNVELDPTKAKLLTVSEDIDKDPRGHVVEPIYKFVVNNDFLPEAVGYTKEVAFFTTLPENIGFNHADVLKSLGY